MKIGENTNAIVYLFYEIDMDRILTNLNIFQFYDGKLKQEFSIQNHNSIKKMNM